MPTVIIITAAVHPSPEFSVAISNPEERLRQYNAALASWLRAAQSTGSRLIVVETSDSTALESTERLDAPEIVRFLPSGDLKRRGKGAVEAAAIDYCLTERGIGDADTIAKATGRLAVTNAVRLIQPVQTGTFRGRRTLDRSFCDTRLFVTAAQTWRTIFNGIALEIEDERKRYLEHVMAHRIAEAEYASGLQFERFAERPEFIGASGTTGKNYKRPPLVAPLLSRIETALFERLSQKQV